jgi:hypothetical protein
MVKPIGFLTGIILLASSLSAYANPDAIVIQNGDLRIKGAGSGLVFPDGSIQYKAPADVPVGPMGPAGPVNALAIGTVVNGPQAGAVITGTAPNQVLNLTLPQGLQGVKGDTGAQGTPGLSVTIPQDSLKSICDLYELVNIQAGANVPFPAFCSTSDCTVSVWTDWSECSEACMGGLQSRSRTILIPPYKGGSGCPALNELQQCNMASCPSGKLIFVSSQRYVANMGGLLGADAKCQGLVDCAVSSIKKH